MLPFHDASLRLLHERRRNMLKLRISRYRAQSAQAKASDLPPPSQSVWYHIYRCAQLFCRTPRSLVCLTNPSHSNRDDHMFLAFVGVPYRVFASLLKRFRPMYKPEPINASRPGRPLIILPHQALAVLLMFYCSRSDNKYLGLIHNLTTRRIDDIVARSEPLMFAVLRNFPDAVIEWPSFKEQRASASRIESKYPLVPRRFGFVDGKNLSVLQSGNVEKQNSQYNGWLHDCFVSGVLVFDANGCLIWCKHNCPGSWNDSDMCRELCTRLMDPTKTLPNHGLCADTAFPVGTALFRHIVSPLKEGELESMSPDVQPAAAAVSSQITSLRQACEWGMGSIQKPFKRLLVPLPWRDSVRTVRLANIFRLWNVRVRNTGISQINESFGS